MAVATARVAHWRGGKPRPHPLRAQCQCHELEGCLERAAQGPGQCLVRAGGAHRRGRGGGGRA
eukprot:9401069-Lingulodinium_polyedra.AAC.1